VFHEIRNAFSNIRLGMPELQTVVDDLLVAACEEYL
jgi:hypothetical protein